MIKLFRRIRQNLLSEGKTGKYFKYAIGEIILVVFGILIALYINNRSNYIKDRKEEAIILRSIHKDLLTSKDEIQNVIGKQKRTVRKTDSLITLFEYYQSGMNKDSLVKANEENVGNYLTKGVFQWFRAEPVTGTYDALIGSGKTELIRSNELKRKLAEYSTIVKSGFEDQGTATSLLSLIIDKQSQYVGSDIWVFDKRRRNEGFIFTDESARNEAIHKMLTDYPFEGLIIQQRSIEGLRLYNQEQLLEFTDELIAIIEKEIN
jgi:hypothetical protein